MGATRGIHLVWTTYGTWLPGDHRGHWSPLFDFYGNLAARGHQLNMPDATTKARALARMPSPPKRLTRSDIATVAEILALMVDPTPPACGRLYSRRHAAGPLPIRTGPHGKPVTPIPGLVIRAATIEPTHVHLLIDPIANPIDDVAGRLKSATSSAVCALSEEVGYTRTWTAGYWKVFLFSDDACAAVAHYITNHNRRRNLPAHPYDWITPYAPARTGGMPPAK